MTENAGRDFMTNEDLLQREKDDRPIYGLMAEFDTPTEVVNAARRAHDAGYRQMDAFSPFPIHELTEAVGAKKTRLPLLVFFGGLVGCVGGFLMQAYLMAVEYPLNVGGRPLVSIPSFIPVTFECTVLLAATTAVVSMIVLNGLPRPYHPVFNVPRFDLASRNRFFLLIESVDPKFNRDETRLFLRSLNSREVSDVDY